MLKMKKWMFVMAAAMLTAGAAYADDVAVPFKGKPQFWSRSKETKGGAAKTADGEFQFTLKQASLVEPKQSWHIQAMFSGVKALAAGDYEFRFEAKSSTAVKDLFCGIALAVPPNTGLVNKNLNFAPGEWQKISFNFSISKENSTKPLLMPVFWLGNCSDGTVLTVKNIELVRIVD